MCFFPKEWEQLNYDIHTLRYTRREVRARWKKILLQMGETLFLILKQDNKQQVDDIYIYLFIFGGGVRCFKPLVYVVTLVGRGGSLPAGYQSEADALLDVNKQSYFNRDQEGPARATELLTQLLEHTSLFPDGTGHRTRYLCVMVHAHARTHTPMSQILTAIINLIKEQLTIGLMNGMTCGMRSIV